MSEATMAVLRARLRERRVAHVLPDCPEAGHGRLLSLNGKPWCPHRGHGGNGRFVGLGEVGQ